MSGVSLQSASVASSPLSTGAEGPAGGHEALRSLTPLRPPDLIQNLLPLSGVLFPRVHTAHSLSSSWLPLKCHYQRGLRGPHGTAETSTRYLLMAFIPLTRGACSATLHCAGSRRAGSRRAASRVRSALPLSSAGICTVRELVR